jgi:hypothetical protein
MNEILPGIWHWTAIHERIGTRVHSYYVASAAALIDPMLPDEGLEWFEQHGPERVLLTNRHHYRHSKDFVDRFGCQVFCHRDGLHEFQSSKADVKGFAVGDTVAPGIRVCEVGVICPDDCALHIDVGDGAMAFADAVIRTSSGKLGFVSDRLLGDDPEAIKSGIRASLRRLAQEETFDSLLFAHGEPMIGGGKAALEKFVADTP